MAEIATQTDTDMATGADTGIEPNEEGTKAEGEGQSREIEQQGLELGQAARTKTSERHRDKG